MKPIYGEIKVTYIKFPKVKEIFAGVDTKRINKYFDCIKKAEAYRNRIKKQTNIHGLELHCHQIGWEE